MADPAIVSDERPDANCDAGFVYILTNAAMPDLVKIGSTRRSPEVRAREISGTTGVPRAFQVAFVLLVEGSAERVERAVHRALAKDREGKEFFRVTVERATAVVENQYAKLYPKLSAAQKERLQRRREEEDLQQKAEQDREDMRRAFRKYAQTPTGKWLLHGFCYFDVLSKGSIPDPLYTVGRGFFEKVFRIQVGPQYVKVLIHPHEDESGYLVMQWSLKVIGQVRGESLNHHYKHKHNFPVGAQDGLHLTLKSAIEQAESVCRYYRAPNQLIRIVARTRCVRTKIELLPGEVPQPVFPHKKDGPLFVQRRGLEGIEISEPFGMAEAARRKPESSSLH